MVGRFSSFQNIKNTSHNINAIKIDKKSSTKVRVIVPFKATLRAILVLQTIQQSTEHHAKQIVREEKKNSATLSTFPTRTSFTFITIGFSQPD